MLAHAITQAFPGRIAVVSSFGAESAVLLHLVSQIDRDIPLIFTNTQKMFGETLAYRDALTEKLGFTDLRVYRPDPALLAKRDETPEQAAAERARAKQRADPDTLTTGPSVGSCRPSLLGFGTYARNA